MVRRVEPLGHIDFSRVAVGFCQTRKAVDHGMYASLTPLRFSGGRRRTRRGGRSWTIQQVCDTEGREMLYLLSFYLPRFLDLAFGEKLTTIMHELWHVGPRFDGDLRRFGGRCYAHGGSQKRFDAQAERLVELWLAGGPPEELVAFLRLDFGELKGRYGGVWGTKIAAPKLIPLD